MVILLTGGCDMQGMATGGSEGVDSDVSGANSADSESSGGSEPGGTINPHWVLRDKDGNVVRAMVRPTCGEPSSQAAKDCAQPDFGEIVDFPCVLIVAYESEFINLMFDLKTGELGGKCTTYQYPGLDTWHFKDVRFESPSCDSQPLVVFENMHIWRDLGTYGLGANFERVQVPARRAGWNLGVERFYPSKSLGSVSDKKLYMFDDLAEGDCVEAYSSSYPHYRLVTIPDQIINLLSSSPYTLSVEY